MSMRFPPSRGRATLSGLLFAAVIGTPLHVLGSGYHPPFDRAVREAVLIVRGTVTRAWDPVPISSNKAPKQGLSSMDQIRPGAPFRVYSMRVKRVYKGRLATTKPLLFIDRLPDSTGSYPVLRHGENLTFLVRPDLTPFESRRYELGALRLYAPIRNLTRKPGADNSDFEGWTYLLERFVARRPGRLVPALRAILWQQTNPEILCYAIRHWPDRLSAADSKLFHSVLLKHVSNGAVARDALERLSKSGFTLDATALGALLDRGDSLLEDTLLDLVNKKNIAGVQGRLFQRLTQPDNMHEKKIAEVLARHAPDFLKAQLRKRALVRWKLLLCLQQLGINGSGVGRPDLPRQVLAANPYTVREIDEVLAGKEFYGVRAMESPSIWTDWEPLLSLLHPALKQPDSPTRRLVVALLRTHGRRLVRHGRGYRVVKTTRPAPAPVRLRLLARKRRFRIGEPVVITVEEELRTSGGKIALRGTPVWKAEGKHAMTLGGHFNAFNKVDLPRSAFVTLERGKTFKTDVTHWSLCSHPSTCTVLLSKLYCHDGGSLGIDAWTGLVWSNPLQIEIVEEP